MSDELQEISRSLKDLRLGVGELYKEVLGAREEVATLTAKLDDLSRKEVSSLHYEVLGTRSEVAGLAAKIADLASCEDLHQLNLDICKIQGALENVDRTAYANSSKIEDLAETIDLIVKYKLA